MICVHKVINVFVGNGLAYSCIYNSVEALATLARMVLAEIYLSLCQTPLSCRDFTGSLFNLVQKSIDA